MEQALFIKSKAPGSTVALTDLAVEKVRELVVAEGAVALLREAGVEFVAPASLVLGCKRE